MRVFSKTRFISHWIYFSLLLTVFLSGCGGGPGTPSPVLHDSFDYSSFPAAPWIIFASTNGNNWSIDTSGGDKKAYLHLVPAINTQTSYFINDNYNKAVGCSVSSRMKISSSPTGTLGLILRASASNVYYLLYYGVQDHQLYIIKVNVGSVGLASSTLTGFDPTDGYHTYKFSISGGTPATLTGYIDGIQKVSATDDGSTYGAVLGAGKPGFAFSVTNTAYITDFDVWEP
jgi:hypothetical protein